MSPLTKGLALGFSALRAVAPATSRLIAIVSLCLVMTLPSAAQTATSVPATSLPDHSSAELTGLIINILDHTDPEQRVNTAVEVLESFGDPGVKALIDILKMNSNEAAKLAVCQAITRTQTTHPDLIPPLMALLDHQESLLREAAAAALAGFRDPEVIDRLQKQECELLQKELVTTCKQLYGLLPTDTDRAAQLQRWLKSTLPLKRMTALEITHEKMITAGTRPSPEVLQQIRQMLNDRDERVRQRLVVILRDTRQSEDAPRLQLMLETERAPAVRGEIYSALGYLGDPTSIPICVEGLGEPSEQVAAQAAAALGRLMDNGASEPLPDQDIVAQALLRRIARPVESPTLREQLVEAMARIGDPRFLPVFRTHALDPQTTPAVRQAALRGIGQIGEPDDVQIILDRLENDTDAGVREFAAAALGKLGSRPEHLERLRERLDAKIEPAAAVQARAWESYKLLFLKALSPADRDRVLDQWARSDPVTTARRVELLADLEKQITTASTDPQRLARVRELLGDAYLSAGRAGDAASAFARALELISPADQEVVARVSGKLMLSHLKTPATEKAVLLVLEAKPPKLRDALLKLLLEHVRETAASDRTAALTLLDKMTQMAPNLFGQPWTEQFQTIRASLISTTQPSTTRAAAPSREG